MNRPMDEPAPRLTIAVPTFNRAHLLPGLLTAICSQLAPDDEVIVSDDASTDNTADAVRELPRVRLIKQDRRAGMVENWNRCLSAARREWICIIHDDDVLLDGGLATLRRACATAEGPAVILLQHDASDPAGSFRCEKWKPGPAAVLDCPAGPSGAVIHRSIIDVVGPFDSTFEYSADLEFFPRCAAKFQLVIITNPRVVDYRLHDGNHQFETWARADFIQQLERIERQVISYANMAPPRAHKVFHERMVRHFTYMFSQAHRLGRTRLIRSIAFRLLFRTGVPMSVRLAAGRAVAKSLLCSSVIYKSQ